MYQGKRFLAIIPCRLGSKRLRNKNIKIFKGKSLFVWTYLNAKKSKYLDKIIISSESNIVLNIARKYGYKYKYLRKKSLAQCHTSSNDVILDIIKNNKKFDYFVFLQPTSPLRTYYDIDNSIEELIKKKKNILLSTKGKSKILNGAIYIGSIKSFIKNKNFKSKKIFYFYMPISRSIDIDYLKDFKKAERLI